MSELTARFKYEGDQAIVEKLANYLKTAKDSELFHIDVYSLAEQWKIDKKALLELFIRGLHEGIFKMEWEYHCPHCGGIPKETLSLHSATSEDFCDLCKVNFTNKLDDNIEVFFSVHPEIRNIPNEYKSTFTKEMVSEIIRVKAFNWKKRSVIRGVDIIQNPVYRELMGDEVLLPDQSLELMKSTILFTDIKGSTKMYTELGDSKAFALVREHFRLVFDVIKKHGGIPVKTIGDAVMGVFANQSDGLRASLEAQKTIIENYKTRPDNEKIELKIGVHAGSTIVVTLNGRLDYFGSTVNMAARVQARALPNEVIISEPIFENNESKRIIGAYTRTVSREKAVFKGLNGERNVYHINLLK
jgi:class 3 adenylate cyclase